MKLSLIGRRALPVWLVLSLFSAAGATPAKSDSLRKELEAIAGRFHGKLGYSLHHLKTGDRLERLGDEQFPTASTIKLAILCAAMEKLMKGELGYDDTRPLTEQDRQYGTGLLHNYRGGTKIPLRDLLNLMIIRSDNTAAIMLGQWVGTDAINGWLDRHALKQTRLLVPFPYQGSFEEAQAKGGKDWEPLKVWGIGVTTPNEMRTLMEMILDGRAGTSAACEEMQPGAPLGQRRQQARFGRHDSFRCGDSALAFRRLRPGYLYERGEGHRRQVGQRTGYGYSRHLARRLALLSPAKQMVAACRF